MISKMLRSFALASLAIGLATVADAQQPWEDVVKAAKKEGTVTLYTSQVGVPQLDEILSAFTDEYGIKALKLELRGSELFEKLRLELATNRGVADMSFSGGSVSLEAMGVLDKHGAIPNATRLAPDFAGSELRLPIFSQSMGIVVNASVPKEKRPKSWADLADPAWKGKILSDDFRSVGGGGLFFAVTYDKLGEDYQKRLAENKPAFTREIRDSPRRVARGEYPIYIPFILPDTLLNKGLPLEVILPSEGVVYGNFDGAVVKNAPHPNAARVLLNFFLSDKAQLIYAGSARRPTVAGLEDRYPPNVKDFLQAPLLGTQEDATVRAEMLKRATEMYK
ncbi:extracellular solute-binding protein [Neorhizobium sp. IRAMC:178]|uniref:ABC transporter substrate-binding protein n=1 Tax=Neorhizobium tunisiense TaxID=3144793 RepID=UPI0031F60E36